MIARIFPKDKTAVARIAPIARDLLSISRKLWNGQVSSFRFSYAEVPIVPKGTNSAA